MTLWYLGITDSNDVGYAEGMGFCPTWWEKKVAYVKNNLFFGQVWAQIQSIFHIIVLQNCKCPEATKPLLIFAGDAFEMNEDYKRLKSLLIGNVWIQLPSELSKEK